MSTRPVPMPTPVAPKNRPLPIQRFQYTADDFKEPKRLNVQMEQLITAVQALQGTAGPSVLPSGIDVVGGRVSGLGAPQDETDAISSGHAEGNFSPEVVSPQLDLGGKHALKGLTTLQLQLSQATAQIKALQAILALGITGVAILAKITGGGTNGSLTFTAGIITAYTPPT